MSSFVWMRVLESAAERYDRGVRWLSGGRIDEVYARVAELAAGAAPRSHPQRVLDVGCGTGGVALACAALGADVVGIDRDAGMLAVARAKALPAGALGAVSWLELGAAEIEDDFPAESFDAVTACLVFSEMGADEQAYVLRAMYSRLVRGGRVVVADEVEPSSAASRALHRLRRLPAAALTYLLTQTTTRPAAGLVDRLSAAGFVSIEEERRWGDSFAIAWGDVPLAESSDGEGRAPRERKGPRREPTG